MHRDENESTIPVSENNDQQALLVSSRRSRQALRSCSVATRSHSWLLCFLGFRVQISLGCFARISLSPRSFGLPALHSHPACLAYTHFAFQKDGKTEVTILILNPQQSLVRGFSIIIWIWTSDLWVFLLICMPTLSFLSGKKGVLFSQYILVRHPWCYPDRVP